MLREWITRCAALAVLLATLYPISSHAETRRAVIIGINRYAVNPHSDRATDLDGAVNDAEAMAESLRTYHEFQASNIHLLLDQKATHAQILSEIREQLIDAAQPGDVSLLFFAGHGSYRENPDSTEADHRDETIVPADTNRGAADITDKQLSKLLGQAVDRKANVIAIFDSCHSGSISRGYYSGEKVRFVEPQSRAVQSALRSDSPSGQAPEQRGALILAAAQDQQQAQEKFVKGQPRGRFSSALQQLLNSAAAGEAADSLFLRLRGLMQAGGSIQEPVLLGTKERRAQPLWGKGSERRLLPRVAVGRLTSSVVFLQAGYVIGLGRGALLRGVQSPAPVQLEVTEVLGPSTSKARVKSGNLGGMNSGDLFEVESFGAPFLEALRVFTPENPPSQKELAETMRSLASLKANRSLTWVTDPTEQTPTHTLRWQRGQWILHRAQGPELPLGTTLSITSLQRSLRGNRGSAVRLFISVPFPAEQLAALQFAPEGSERSVERVADPSRADYLLMGRWSEGKLAYALILPGADRSSRPATPLRTDWVSIDDIGCAELLNDYALRLARIKTWQQLDTPAGVSRFSYSLRLQNAGTQALLLPGTRVRNGEIYQPVLQAVLPAQRPVLPVQPRYVYLFSIDSAGGITLLVPGSGMGVGENLVPDARNRGTQPTLIPIGDRIGVGPPFGTDTMVLLTSATALPDPSVLAIAPVQRGIGSKKRCQHPLECLIFGINEEDTRSRFAPPTDWSIERIIVESAE